MAVPLAYAEDEEEDEEEPVEGSESRIQLHDVDGMGRALDSWTGAAHPLRPRRSRRSYLETCRPGILWVDVSQDF